MSTLPLRYAISHVLVGWRRDVGPNLRRLSDQLYGAETSALSPDALSTEDVEAVRELAGRLHGFANALESFLP